QRGEDDRPLADEDVAAQAAFWRAASVFAGGRTPTGNDEDGHLALCGISEGVAGSFCDILNWHAVSCWGEGAEAVIRAEVANGGDDVLRGRVAVVRFTGGGTPRTAPRGSRTGRSRPPPRRPGTPSSGPRRG
ncbi:hypothetical protein THAOC_13993, partial [Thalassiosira oceanica]